MDPVNVLCMSFTLDTWISQHSLESSVWLTGHWIDIDFQWRSSVPHEKEFHTRENIKYMVCNMMTQRRSSHNFTRWGIEMFPIKRHTRTWIRKKIICEPLSQNFGSAPPSSIIYLDCGSSQAINISECPKKDGVLFLMTGTTDLTQRELSAVRYLNRRLVCESLFMRGGYLYRWFSLIFSFWLRFFS